MDVEVDWDLQAVVRGCTSFASAIKQTDDESPFHDNNSFGQRFQFQPKLNDDAPLQPQEDNQLHDLFKPFFSASISYPLLPFSSTILTSPLTPMERKRPINDVLPGCSRLQHGNNASNSATPRSKRRKNSQVKKVCQVSAEGVSSSNEKWSWRKYGQKPIKGSPYPRGYYRCSSSKGCPARKQVERNRSDPNMFIVTYTADHNHPAPTHRNSLAGITRPISKAAATSSSSVPTTPSSDDENLDVLESMKTEHQEDHRNNDFFDEIARDGSAADVFPQLARSSRGHS